MDERIIVQHLRNHYALLRGGPRSRWISSFKPRMQPGGLYEAAAKTPGDQDHRLTEKKSGCLVTGAVRGIGRAIVKCVRRRGAKVGFVYRGNQAAADALRRRWPPPVGPALALQAESADAALPGLRGAGRKEWGRDILVNNAGSSATTFSCAWSRRLAECAADHLGGTYNFARRSPTP